MTRRRRWLIGLGCAAAAIALSTWVVLSITIPSIVRSEIAASLRAAGFKSVDFELVRATPWSTLVRTLSTGDDGALSVGEALIQYHPLDAINGRIDSVVIREGRLLLSLTPKPAPPASSHPSSQPAASTKPSGASLPIRSIRAESCVLILVQGHDEVELLFDGTLTQSPDGGSALHAKASINESPIVIDGTLQLPSQTIDIAAMASGFPLDRAIRLVPASARGAIGDLSGNADVKASLSIADGRTSFEVTATAPTIKVAGQEASDVHVALSSGPDATAIKDLRFTWAGGVFSAEPLVLPTSSNDVSLTLSAKSVDLEKAMKIALQGHVSGSGTVSGRIPVAFKNNQITFGQGSVQSDGPGTLRLGGAAASIADVLDQTDPSFRSDRGQQVKKQVLESIQDFQYDRLSAVFIPGDKGLVVSVNIQGQGRSGAKQPLDITLNFHGFERGLNTYLAGRSRVLDLGR